VSHNTVFNMTQACSVVQTIGLKVKLYNYNTPLTSNIRLYVNARASNTSGRCIMGKIKNDVQLDTKHSKFHIQSLFDLWPCNHNLFTVVNHGQLQLLHMHANGYLEKLYQNISQFDSYETKLFECSKAGRHTHR
jgi:hypothetical protein